MPRKINIKKSNKNLEALATPISKDKLRPSAGRENTVGEFYYLDLEALLPDPNQARKTFNQEDLQSLSETITKHGIRQPLTVKKNDEKIGTYFIISGERRARAAKLSGLSRVPCIVLEDSDNDAEIALVENIQRKDLHPLEIASALKITLNHTGENHTELASSLGISRTMVSEYLKYLELPENIQNILLEKGLTNRSIYRRLLKCNNENSMLSMLGASNTKSKKQRARKVVELYVRDGKLSLDKCKTKISDKLKEDMILQLEKFIQDLKAS